VPAREAEVALGIPGEVPAEKERRDVLRLELGVGRQEIRCEVALAERLVDPVRGARAVGHTEPLEPAAVEPAVGAMTPDASVSTFVADSSRSQWRTVSKSSDFRAAAAKAAAFALSSPPITTPRSRA